MMEAKNKANPGNSRVAAMPPRIEGMPTRTKVIRSNGEVSSATGPDSLYLCDSLSAADWEKEAASFSSLEGAAALSSSEVALVSLEYGFATEPACPEWTMLLNNRPQALPLGTRHTILVPHWQLLKYILGHHEHCIPKP